MKINNRWIPLKALETFEVAARHQNLSAAAQELGVTRSAVSHQIRNLEEALGTQLFDRTGRRIAISSKAHALLAPLQGALRDISSAVQNIGAQETEGTLTVAMPSSFIALWLAQRLPNFLTAHPTLQFRRTLWLPGMQPLDLKTQMAIVFEEAQFPGHQVVPLIECQMFPVCAPGYEGLRHTHDVRDLRNSTLIHSDEGEAWAKWFTAAGAPQIDARQHIYAGSTHDALAIARNGLGFAISDNYYAPQTFLSGDLIQPFARKLSAKANYYLVSSPEDRLSEPERAFRDWLLEEVSLYERFF
ncbi:LysR substrate-binding domain-containing protein [uncultured Shimia sp.]|uniref:LysR substrate-binding domain-containing protein n=1 Tax=uncultured Shimia sp. TaxID=573152 RepID=UPI0026088B05|nr:LysR substrate-binding domain-containing protein [uncultured Shimia sp.]